MSRLRHWLFVQRSRIWAVARGMRRMLTPTLAPNVNQITDQLFVGGFIDRHDWSRLFAQGITVDVNLQAERQDRFIYSAQHPEAYLWLPTMDHSAPDLRALHAGVAFVQAALRQEQKVLIHCHAGMGRSALLCCAVLVAEGLTVEAAWQLVKQQRPIANLHPWQWQALRAFAAHHTQQQEAV